MLIVVRFGLYLALAVPFGLAAFALYAPMGRGGPAVSALRTFLASGMLTALLLSLIALCLSASAMSGVEGLAIDREAIGMLLATPGMGTAWLIRAGALFLGLALLRWSRRTALVGVLVASGVALSTQPWTGHGAAGEGPAGLAHLLADIVHLLAAGLWLGALTGLLLMLWRADGTDGLLSAHLALERFSGVGSAVVGVLIATGLLNTWALVGFDHLGRLSGSLYGRLLLLKLALFAAMLILAALNRWRLTPALAKSVEAGDSRSGRGVLRRSLAFETAAAVLIMALVAWLGTLAPAGA